MKETRKSDEEECFLEPEKLWRTASKHQLASENEKKK